MNEIEKLNQRRVKNLTLYLCGYVIFLVLWLVRYFLRQSNLNAEPAGIIVLMGLVLSLLLLILSTVESVRLGIKVRKDSALADALGNEWVQMLEKEAWKSAFCAAVGATVFFAASWFIYPVCDPVMIALTSIIAGAGGYQISFYLRYRTA
ncbi:MAG: hypothetical protein JXA25_11450 [Anaerolineales bacterium]|nr:hypothetical protein [Anaerolineales bacterium]